MDINISKDKNISRWVDIESKSMHKAEEGDWQGKKN